MGKSDNVFTDTLWSGEMTRATALSLNEKFDDNCQVISRNAREKTYRDGRVCMKSYQEGQSSAFNEASRLAKIELERLENLFQNGALTLDSFRTY